MRAANGGVALSCCVKANAKRPSVLFEDGCLAVAVTSSPVENRANREVVELLAEAFSARRADVLVIAGAKSKSKTVLIKGISEDQARAVIQKLESSGASGRGGR